MNTVENRNINTRLNDILRTAMLKQLRPDKPAARRPR